MQCSHLGITPLYSPATSFVTVPLFPYVVSSSFLHAMSLFSYMSVDRVGDLVKALESHTLALKYAADRDLSFQAGLIANLARLLS